MIYLDTSFLNEFDKDIEDKKVNIMKFNDLSLFLEREREENYTFLLYLNKDLILSKEYKKSTYSNGPLQYKKVIDIVNRMFHKFLYVDLDIGENAEKVKDYPSFKELASFVERFNELKSGLRSNFRDFILFDLNLTKGNKHQLYFINNSFGEITYSLLIDNKEEINEVKMKKIKNKNFQYNILSHCDIILKNEIYIDKNDLLFKLLDEL